MTTMLSSMDNPRSHGVCASRLRDLIRRRSTFFLGAIDQGALSVASLLLTLVLANALDVWSFGRFSIAWAFSILLESVFFRGLFDDGLPAVAHRLAHSRWPQLRASVYALSMMVASGFGALLGLIGCIAVVYSNDDGWLLVATGVAITANRLQSVFRRLAYLDGRLLRVVSGAIIYTIVLSGMVLAMISTRTTNAAAAMACIAVAAMASGAFGLLHRATIAQPSRRVLIWTARRLSRAGRWFVATSFSYWLGSIGLIPLCGSLIGLEASASLRVMLVVFAPLSQLNASMMSVKLPGLAQLLKSRDPHVMASEVRSNALLFGGSSVIYGLVAVLVGMPTLSLFLDLSGFGITELNLSLMALAMSMDGIWLGLSLPLFATGHPQQFFVSRMVGLASLGVGLIVFAPMWGITGIVSAMVLSSAVSVVLLWRHLTSGRSTADRENA